MAENNQGITSPKKQSERDVIEGNARMSGASSPGDSANASSNATSQDVKQQAKDMANQTKEQGKTMLEQKKGAAAGQVDSMAHAFRTTAEHLQGEGQQRTGDYVGMIADQLENAARQLKQKNLDEILHDAQDLARRSPATFIAGSVAVGFLLARFLKSSSDQSGEYREQYHGADRSRYGAHNMDSEDSTGLESGAVESNRTGTPSYSGISDSRASGGPAYESTALDPDREGARFTSASASPLAGAAATGYSPAGTNAADIAGTQGSAINPSNTSTLGGNNYGNR